MFFRRRLLSAVITASEVAALPELDAPYLPPPVCLKQSVDPAQRPTILFGPPPEGVTTVVAPTDGLGSGQPLFKITSPTCDYVSLRLALLKAGFRRISAGPKCDELPANVVWGKSMPAKIPPPGSPKERAYHSTKLTHPYQRFNHFPSSHSNLGCKAGLAMNLSRFPDKTKTFNPPTLIYPSQKAKIRDIIASSPKHHRFIWKPARGSCGRGIIICDGGDGDAVLQMEEGIARRIQEAEASNTSPLMYKHYVVQKYIDDPLLIDKKKFDLRIYVSAASFLPDVVAYRHQLGFARFAATDYKGDAIGEKYSHLTNFSIGRKVFDSDPREMSNKSEKEILETIKLASERASELKWTFEQLNHVLDTDRHRVTAAPGVVVDRASMWAAVDDVIRTTLMTVKDKVARQITEQDKMFNSLHGTNTSFSNSYFEVYGFDIMFDSQCRPWLIEVNTLPSLESSSVRDYHLKSKVVTDLLNMAMIVPFERTDKERHLFASAHPIPAGGTDSPEGVGQTVRSFYPREALPTPSPAASLLLLGKANRYHVSDPFDEKANRIRRQDEDRCRGGFIRIL